MIMSLASFTCLATAQIRSVWSFRTERRVALLTLLVHVSLSLMVWKAIMAASSTTPVMSRQETLAYVAFAQISYFCLVPWTFSSVTERVRSGAILSDLTRPVGFLSQVFARNVGTYISQLPLAAVAVIVACLLGARLQTSLASLALCAASLVFSTLLTLALNTLMSLVSIWTVETSGLYMMYRTVASVCSGAVVPLAFFPTPARTIVEYLPFRSMVDGPTTILVRHATLHEAVSIIAVQIVWLLLTALLMWVTWCRGVRRLCVVGG